MRSVSDFIASTGHVGEPKPVGPITCTVFVLTLVASMGAAAVFIGSALAEKPPVPFEAAYAAE